MLMCLFLSLVTNGTNSNTKTYIAAVCYQTSLWIEKKEKGKSECILLVNFL